MSNPKVIGPTAAAGAAAATLPTTGQPIIALVVAGAILVATGLLLLRSSRIRRTHQ
jgi:LPXTG-motif cell wall-anchored protein